MSDPLIRGAVVMRDVRCSVVWAVAGDELVLLPILRPRTRWAYDVALELADLVACGVTMPRAVIRPRANPPCAAGGWAAVGQVPGATMCRVVHGLVRGIAEARAHEKWSDDDRHRRNARGRCVNLVR